MKNLPLSLALAASSGLFTLQRPADWSPRVRRSFVLLPGAALGAISILAVRRGYQIGREPAAAGAGTFVAPVTAGTRGAAADADAATADASPAESPARKTVVAVAGAVIAGTTASGVLALSLVLDERIETWLVRRCVARPRRVMAVVAALSSLTLDLVVDSKDAKKATHQSS